MRRGRIRRPLVCVGVGSILLFPLPSIGVAQTLEGRVLDELDDAPVATALVRLLDESGDEASITVADSSGFYRIVAPEPGVYRMVAERLGYEPFETPLLQAGNPDGVYPLDLLMRPAPIPIPGLEVSTDRADREIRTMIGVSPSSLRVPPLSQETIRDHVERAHDLSAMMRWGNIPGVIVRETTEGPCFQVRGRSCLPVYLNGFRMNPTLVPAIPLDMVYTVVVVMPNESIRYAGGALLLYTAAWLR